MFVKLAKFLGSIVLFLASMAIITAMSLFVVGAFLSTWPVLRMSPQNRRLQAAMGLLVAVFALAREYQGIAQGAEE